MKNKLIRLAELIQEEFPEDFLPFFRTEEHVRLEDRLELVSKAISHHQGRSAQLWLSAGKKRSIEEKQAAARAELAAFLLAYLAGDPRENAETAMEALETLGRQSEVDLIKSLCRKR